MRLEDWETRFRRTLDAWEGRPFVWGESDCAHFAAAIVEAVTGRDVLATWRGAYASRLTAVARLRGRGYRTLTDAMGAALEAHGAFRIDPRAAAAGDIGATQDDVACVRVAIGWIARDESGGYRLATPVTAWAV